MSPRWRTIKFFKKVYIKILRLSKHKDILAMRCITKNEEFQFVYLIGTILKTTSNAIFNMKKVDLDKS